MSARWLAVSILAIGCGVAVLRVASDHALEIQVVVAAAGAVLTVGGAGVAAHAWPGRGVTEWRALAAATGIFGACVGVFAIAIGAGLFH